MRRSAFDVFCWLLGVACWRPLATNAAQTVFRVSFFSIPRCFGHIVLSGLRQGFRGVGYLTLGLLDQVVVFVPSSKRSASVARAFVIR